MYRERFGLYQNEIELARCFFSKAVPGVFANDLASGRTSDDFQTVLTYYDLCDYTYENGHMGVYPLDTNDEGILSRLHGSYDCN